MTGHNGKHIGVYASADLKPILLMGTLAILILTEVLPLTFLLILLLTGAVGDSFDFSIVLTRVGGGYDFRFADFLVTLLQR